MAPVGSPHPGPRVRGIRETAAADGIFIRNAEESKRPIEKPSTSAESSSRREDRVRPLDDEARCLLLLRLTLSGDDENSGRRGGVRNGREGEGEDILFLSLFFGALSDRSTKAKKSDVEFFSLFSLCIKFYRRKRKRERFVFLFLFFRLFSLSLSFSSPTTRQRRSRYRHRTRSRTKEREESKAIEAIFARTLISIVFRIKNFSNDRLTADFSTTASFPSLLSLTLFSLSLRFSHQIHPTQKTI